MKKIICLLLTLSLLLCGCGGASTPAATQASTVATETTEAPATEAPTTEEPTTEPAPVYTNPLNGKTLDTPFTGRVYAVSISNIRGALPHYGTMNADILMEMWVNGSIVRDLALFTDPTQSEAIGSVRSVRPMFNEIAKHYDAVIFDAGGSEQALGHAKKLGVDRFNIDTQKDSGYSFRNTDRAYLFKNESGWEHCLFARGDQLEALAQEKGFRTTQPEDKEYNLRFREDGTPENGESAENVTVTFTYRNNRKDTSMVYDAALGKYVYNQYDQAMVLGDTQDPETFTNVIVMLADITTDGIYYTANFEAGGQGYYANGGKIIPITWGADDAESPFWFKTVDGEPLELGVGNTYMAIAPVDSPVSYQ